MFSDVLHAWNVFLPPSMLSLFDSLNLMQTLKTLHRIHERSQYIVNDADWIRFHSKSKLDCTEF